MKTGMAEIYYVDTPIFIDDPCHKKKAEAILPSAFSLLIIQFMIYTVVSVH
jgi:hypothetical protein